MESMVLKMRKMKDSGIEWIGEIPEGWELTKVKRIFDIGRGRVISQQELTSVGYPVYSSQTKNNGCLGYISTYDFDKSQLTWTTDGVNAGTVFLREGKHNCTNVCGTLAPKNDTNDLRYLKYALEYIAFYHKRADINGFKIMNNEMAEIELLLPPLFEQQNIANYLDFKCSQTQSILEQSLFSIEEYKKLKQAVITQAVTKGVRGEREMKDCGVEWAGLVPHHWGVAKIGSIGQTSSGATPLRSKESSFFDDATIRWVRTLDLNDGFVYDSSEKITELALASSACSIMPKGTVCVAMYGGAGTIGKCGLLMSDCATNQAVCSIVCNRKIVSPIFLLMQLLALKPYWMKYAVGTRKDPNISQDIVARMKILIPPLDEQKEITDYLDAKCAEIDKLIAKKEQLVKELESYKKSLIYEVVTGKREV